MLGKLVREHEESKSHQEAEEAPPRWWVALAFTLLQDIISDFLSCTPARHEAFPEDVARVPSSQELAFLC